ncbi:MAG: hypothetical protein KME08_06420 [Aphanothece sp. CMT-3BRIN-NPC111]|nr:hypothetical protein [Aphanothece sp. CMT-3BRIN-NPC111]
MRESMGQSWGIPDQIKDYGLRGCQRVDDYVGLITKENDRRCPQTA